MKIIPNNNKPIILLARIGLAGYCGNDGLSPFPVIIPGTDYNRWTLFNTTLIRKNEVDKDHVSAAKFDHMLHPFRYPTTQLEQDQFWLLAL
jgi:hypothetical protein